MHYKNNYNNVPDELKKINQWVVHSNKIPINPILNKPASVSSKDTWSDFETAVKKSSEYSGIGFVFNNNNIIGIDIDNVLDSKLQINDTNVNNIINKFNSYTEISPSGKGLHIFIFGNIPFNGKRTTVFDNRNLNIEIYKANRYFTVTGNIYKDLNKIRNCQEEIDNLISKLSIHNNYSNKFINNLSVNSSEENEIIKITKLTQKDSLLYKLWNGHRPHGNESIDDMSLISKLAYYLDEDKNKIIKAFLNSPHVCQKDAKHFKKIQREDYLNNTVNKVIASMAINKTSNNSNDSYDKLFQQSNYKIQNGNFFREYKKNNCTERQYLGNFFIVLEKEILKNDGIFSERYYKLKPICNGEELESKIISSKKLTSANYLTEEWGLILRPAIINNISKYYNDSISAQYSFVQTETIFTHTGWTKVNNNWIFLHAGGCIGSENISVELDDRLSRYCFFDYKNKNIELDIYKKVVSNLFNLASNEIIYTLISLTFLCPLNEFFRHVGLEPSFVIYLLGTTGSMKSTIAALFLSFFGNFDNRSLPSSFKDTKNSLEKQGFILKDVLTVIDDFHPTNSSMERKEMESLAQYIARAYGDRIGRNRMNCDTTLKKAYIPRGNVIITGEDLPNIGQSGNARCLVVEISKNNINIDILTSIQNDKDILSVLMAKYIEWLIPQADNLSLMIEENFKNKRQNSDLSDIHGRISDTNICLYIGMSYFLKFMKHLNIFSNDYVDEILEKSNKIFLEISENQQSRLLDNNPAKMFISALKELVETNIVSTVPIEYKDEKPHSFIGYHDSEYYYLMPQTTYSKVVQFYKAQEINFPVNKNMLLKQLGGAGYIKFKNHLFTLQKKINNKNARYIWLYKNFL